MNTELILLLLKAWTPLVICIAYVVLIIWKDLR